MYDFFNSIFNVIGEYVNSFLDFCLEKKEKEKKPNEPVKVKEESKHVPWTKKKK